MVEPLATDKVMDSLLAPFLAAASESEAELLLSGLMRDHAAPICHSVIRKKLKVSLQPTDTNPKNQDALEVWGDTQITTLTELRNLRQPSQGRAISNLRNFIAGLAHHACYAYLRRQYPQRHSLKNKLRYLLANQPQLAVWGNSRHETLTGLARWSGSDAAYRRSAELQKLCDNPTAVAHGLGLSDAPPAQLLTELFSYAGCPVEFDDLVDIVAEIWQVREAREVPADADEDGPTLGETLRDESVDIALAAEQKARLAQLWAELCELPARQRVAILLNLRDASGRGVIELFMLTSAANFAQLAAALELSVNELATLWNDLPLDDAAIAERLGVTRQQVINLRKAGRDRLWRRTRDF
jgi:hypothetical protein